MTNNTDIIHKAGLRPIPAPCYGSRTKTAALLMAGRTLYYESDTLRFFDAHVSRLHVDLDGIAMVALERIDVDPSGTRKGWRVVIHDLTGRQLHAGAFGATQRDQANLMSSRRDANREFEAACQALAVSRRDVLRDAITAEIAGHVSALAALRSARL